MKQRIAVVGDNLSSGGSVLPAGGAALHIHGSSGRIDRRASISHRLQKQRGNCEIRCPYCLGFVAEVVLDDDIVFCKCPKPPHIVATLSGESWCDGNVEGSGQNVPSSLTTTGGVASIVAADFDEQVEAVVDRSEGYPYYIETTDGRVFQGRLDTDGALPRIHTGDSPNDYAIYWGDDPIAKENEA
ncbi:PAAR domain-containing protein [Burkholderia stagnalis]|uniref:PAAR domain-containing protein n=1 Tax=Burkholderia stagnalis TaxID=1503054 RepID=UPI001E3E047B|nr:PAAR domain-containing protein [Burkholderia stagnalis]